MDKDIMEHLCLNLVLLGGTGVGKSSSGNTILGRDAFVSESSSTSVTHNVAVEIGNICGLPIRVYDTPGCSDTGLSKEDLRKYEKILQECELGLCAFLVVLPADRFTKEDQAVLENIQELLGSKRIQNTWILFTRGDELEEENKTINKVIKDTEYLKRLSQKYEGRHHVLNNKQQIRCDDQSNALISKVLHRNIENLSRRQRTPVNIPVERPLSRRIVLLGKSGVGKSAAANKILGKKVFESTVGSISVTRESSVKHATVSGREVSVVDTPGLFDTHMSSEQLLIEIARSVYISSPGPHAFLIVFPVNRFTQQEEEIAQIIEMLFGEEVLKYSIILFTHGDQLEGRSIQGIIEENAALRHLVDQCGGRFHVFNNRDENNREQVNDLLQKIDTMIEQNGGGHYSNQMYEDAQKFRKEEETERLRKEVEQRIGKEVEQRVRAEIQRENNVREQQEKIQRQKEIEGVRRQTEERVRAVCEAQMIAKMERLKVERQREEEERKQQGEIQRREEIEGVRRQTEERVRAECEAQMIAKMERLKVERKREEEERKQQEEIQRREEIEGVIRERVRAEIQREKNERQQEEDKNTPESEERSGFKKFFSKYWKYFLMGIAAGAIVGGIVGGVVGGVGGGGVVGGVVGGIVGGVVGVVGIIGGVVALIVDKMQKRN